MELEEDFDFQGIFLGGDYKEFNVGHRQVFDARKGNLVVLDNSSAQDSDPQSNSVRFQILNVWKMVAFSKRLIPNIQADTSGSEGVEKEKDSGFLGDWEKEVQVGYVRERVYPEHFTAQHRKKEEPEVLELYLCEPCAVDVKTNAPFLPNWLFCLVAKELHGVVVPSTWEDVKRLPWREIQSMPLRIHEACYSDTFTNDGQRTFDENFMGTGVKARVRFDLQKANRHCKTLLQIQPFGQVHYTCQLEDKDERSSGALLPEDALERIKNQ